MRDEAAARRQTAGAPSWSPRRRLPPLGTRGRPGLVPPRDVRRARLAVFAVFWLCGVICSLWSASLPTLNARLHLGETRLGVVLLMVGAGAMAIMPGTGRLCDRWTSRAVVRVGGPVTALTLIGPALAPGFPVLLAAAFVLGSGIGSLGV